MNNQQAGKAFDFASSELRSEISLFWQRSLFFWGFIAAAFVAYGTLFKETDKDLAFSISCFGFLCSVAWALLNRGSKYWQIHWEKKLKQVEEVALGEKFYSKDVINPDRKIWGAARYSVTKLTMALSDFVVLVWLVLAYKVSPTAQNLNWSCVELAIVGVTAAYAVAMLIGTWSVRSS